MLKRCFNFPLPKLAAEAKKTQSKAPPVTGSNHNLILAEILREAESSTVKFYDTSVMISSTDIPLHVKGIQFLSWLTKTPTPFQELEVHRKPMIYTEHSFLDKSVHAPEKQKHLWKFCTSKMEIICIFW